MNKKETNIFIGFLKNYTSFIIVTSLVSFLVGMSRGYDKKCNYSSIATRINVAYILGCEFYKPRFEKN